MNKSEFIKSEGASTDTIDLKRIYVDMTGDLVTGLLLSQIIYWHLPSKKTHTSKLRVYHAGHYWIAKRREDWWDECCISAKQFDRASKELEEFGFIQTAIFKFDGTPTKHVRLDWTGFLPKYNAALKEYAESENESSPKGEIEIAETEKSLTESTPENTKDIGDAKPASPPPLSGKEQTAPVTYAQAQTVHVVKDAAREAADLAAFEGMPGASEGLPPLGELSAGVADARIGAQDNAAWIAERCQEVLPMPVTKKTEKGLAKAVKQIAELKIPRDRLVAYFKYLNNGSGERLRTNPDANWFILCAKLTTWQARGFPPLVESFNPAQSPADRATMETRRAAVNLRHFIPGLSEEERAELDDEQYSDPELERRRAETRQAAENLRKFVERQMEKRK